MFIHCFISRLSFVCVCVWLTRKQYKYKCYRAIRNEQTRESYRGDAMFLGRLWKSRCHACCFPHASFPECKLQNGHASEVGMELLKRATSLYSRAESGGQSMESICIMYTRERACPTMLRRRRVAFIWRYQNNVDVR